MERNKTQESVSQGNRRAFLRRAATSTTLGFVGIEAFLGGAVGNPEDVDDEELAKAQGAYDSPDKVRRAVKEQGAEVLQTLVSEEALPTASVGNLPVNSILTPEEFVDSEEGTVVSAKAPDGVASAHIVIETVTEDANVLITILPQADKAYARVKEDGAATIYDPGAGYEDGFSTSACYTGYTCARCNDGCCTYEVVCCQEDCYFDAITEPLCDPCYDVCWAYCEDPCYGDYDDGC